MKKLLCALAFGCLMLVFGEPSFAGPPNFPKRLNTPHKARTVVIESHSKNPQTIELQAGDVLSFTCQTKISPALYDPMPLIATVHPLDEMPGSVLQSKNEFLSTRQLARGKSGEYVYENWNFKALRPGQCEIWFQDQGEPKVHSKIKIVVSREETLVIDWGKPMTDTEIKKALVGYNVVDVESLKDPDPKASRTAYYVTVASPLGTNPLIRAIRKNVSGTKLVTDFNFYPIPYPTR